MKNKTAIDLLEEQHKETLELLEKLEKSGPGAARRQAFGKLNASLLAHMTIEEELFYPAIIAASEKDGEPLAEGYEEDSVARNALARCARGLGQARLFQVRVMVLKELVKHHIKEERSSILPRARKAIPRADLIALGTRMNARFKKALGRAGMASELDRLSTARTQRALVE